MKYEEFKQTLSISNDEKILETNIEVIDLETDHILINGIFIPYVSQIKYSDGMVSFGELYAFDDSIQFREKALVSLENINSFKCTNYP